MTSLALRSPSLLVALGCAVSCAEAPLPQAMETDAIRVELAEPRVDGRDVVAGPIRVRMKDDKVPGIRKLFLFVIDDKNGDGDADEGEEMVGSEQPYAPGCREVSYSFRARLEGVERARLAVAWRVEFGTDGKAAGYKLLQR